MNVLKIALIACCFSAAAAHAETTQQQVSQTNDARSNSAATPSRNYAPAAAPASAPASKADECVGPVSYCNVFFGS